MRARIPRAKSCQVLPYEQCPITRARRGLLRKFLPGISPLPQRRGAASPLELSLDLLCHRPQLLIGPLQARPVGQSKGQPRGSRRSFLFIRSNISTACGSFVLMSRSAGATGTSREASRRSECSDYLFLNVRSAFASVAITVQSELTRMTRRAPSGDASKGRLS
jgi:hypothetical protein